MNLRALKFKLFLMSNTTIVEIPDEIGRLGEREEEVRYKPAVPFPFRKELDLESDCATHN